MSSIEPWQDEWPKEKGLWWFYGWRFGKYRDDESPELCLVDVHGTAVKGQFAYVTHGHFLHKTEGARGKWLRVELPELPKLE